MDHDSTRIATVAPALELRGISKRYGPVVACDSVDLTVQGGEVHGLLGENGAGKSTLMKVLMGLVACDAGEIHRDGVPVRIDSPQEAARLGLGMVHQHFSLIEPLTVWENVALGEVGRVERDRICTEVEAVGARYGLVIDPVATVDRLSAGERQRVEIIKCLRRDPKVLVLDEPTSVLTLAESGALFEVLRQVVRVERRGVILISHKLAEIAAATDVVSVLRKGRLAFSCRTQDTSTPELARQMVGRDVSLHDEGAALGLVVTDDPTKHLTPALRPGGLEAVPGEPPVELVAPGVTGTAALGLHELTVHGPDGRVLLNRLSLEVGPGEIVGLYGVEGNGQAPLGDLLAGLLAPSSGEVTVGGRAVDLARVGALHEAGVAVIPEDRHRSGVVLDMSVAENLVMTDLARVSDRLLRRGQIRARATELVARFGISTPSIDTPLRNLSGGNQQRVVLARELSADPTVLVAAQPTHGLDVGAIEDMYARLRVAADAGVAILLISTELEEVMALAGRIAVICSGRITGVLDVADASPQRLGMLVGGEAA